MSCRSTAAGRRRASESLGIMSLAFAILLVIGAHPKITAADGFVGSIAWVWA